MKKTLFAKRNIFIFSFLVIIICWLPAIASAAQSSISANSSAANNSTLNYGNQVRISGQISPAHQATVTIKSKRRGKSSYSKLGATTSDASGNYSYKFNVGASGHYIATWNGDGDHSAAQSSSTYIAVRAKIYLNKIKRPKWAGQYFYVWGKLSPSHKRKLVSLQVRKGRKWKTISRARTNRSSRYKIRGSIGRKGTFRLRVAFRDIDHALSSSSGFNVKIRKANPWNISAKYKYYIVVSKRTYKLWYLRRGRIVKTFRAGVGQRRYPTPSGNFRITRKATRPTWYPPKSESWAKNEPDAVPWPASPLGARGLYLNTGRIIIHGTSKPWLLDRPGRAISHGCIRLKNSWVIWLYNRVPTGTRVKIYG